MRQLENLKLPSVTTPVLKLVDTGPQTFGGNWLATGKKSDITTGSSATVAVSVGPINNTTQARVVYTSQPSSGETEMVPPIMTREELKQELLALGKKHGMKSEDFYRRWQAGQAPKILDALRWVLLYELWQDRYLMP